jgi:c(7)-type cytochrome triheme protein
VSARATVLVATVTAFALALLAPHDAGAEPAPAAGFDHLAHRTRVGTSALAAPPCAACHSLAPAGTLAGRPGHAACFPCHGPAPRRPLAAGAEPPAVCVVCHPPAGLTAARPPLATPAYGPDREHGLQLDHARHAAAPCERCHPRAAPSTAPRAHLRCAGCHLTTRPAMTACEACHPAEIGPDTRPHLITTPLSVTRSFSHGRHAARGGAAPPSCATCHAAISTTAARELPTPTAATCSAGGCHDGGAAFATTVACTRCHAPPANPPPPWSPAARFLHRAHEPLMAIASCDRCHRLDRRGEPTVPDHAACASAGCHPSDFGSPRPTICGACHLASEPWRRLQPDQRPPDDTELGVALSHRRHPGACTGCHQLTTARRALRPPRGHRACTGDGCHAAARGPAPRLDACQGCHQPGVVEERRRRRSLALWSVAATFDHARHAIDPRDGRALACAACHDPAMASAAGDAPLPAPAKPSCAPCHDGATAFKMTGHGCARCHRGTPAEGAR